MRKLVSFFTVFTLLFLACEGPQGPPGFDGRDGLNGLDGEVIASSAFEIVLDFTPANNYEFIEPYGFNVLPTDVTLVYISWEVDNGQDVWRLLPQTEYFNDGVLVYNYDFTQTDVRFFLDGTTDFSLLDPSYTDAQVFRVVVVPADNVGRIDISNLEAVQEAFGITEFSRR
ncbi:hypothetical protein [Winogradskyella alexanderae]|uniref:Collagen-like protein n=1 Tax=Winogradskyella alexanderae TaxID=2877123 RepID=A0ABS7XT24_9FLAO|nr:hypothetical protein [Winogradskyella alexanderae]MCA0133189.1 hypothetical protein [Winogradskyella alexanderae]